jgi:hypothetical protein
MVVSALVGHLIWIKAADHSVMLYWFYPRDKSVRSYDKADRSRRRWCHRAGYAVGTLRA